MTDIEVRCRQRLQVRFFFLEADRRRLPELAQLALVRNLGNPLLQQQINVREAVELPVTDEDSGITSVQVAKFSKPL